MQGNISQTVLSLIHLTPIKHGSYEDFEIRLSEKMSNINLKHIKVFTGPPYSDLYDTFSNANSIVDTLPNPTFNNIRKLIKKYKPDLVHISFYPMDSFLPIILRLLGVKKIIVTDHFSSRSIPKNWLKDKVRKVKYGILFAPVCKFIAVSNFVKKRLIARNGIKAKKVALIYNGIDIDRFSKIDCTSYKLDEFHIPENTTIITFVGQLENFKGLSYLLDAVKNVVKKTNNVFFLIVGAGSEKIVLEKKAKNLGILDKVHFCGLRNDVNQILHKSDIFVCPSTWDEAFGLVIAEAMASKLPIVATKVGGIPELVSHDKNGILVSAFNSNELSVALKQLIENKNLRTKMGETSRKIVVEKFNLERMVDKTLRIYINTLSD